MNSQWAVTGKPNCGSCAHNQATLEFGTQASYKSNPFNVNQAREEPNNTHIRGMLPVVSSAFRELVHADLARNPLSLYQALQGSHVCDMDNVPAESNPI